MRRNPDCCSKLRLYEHSSFNPDQQLFGKTPAKQHGCSPACGPSIVTGASVVTTSKYRKAFQPIRPAFRRSPMPAMPTTTVVKITGPISIFTNATKASPSGLSCPSPS